MNKHEIIDILKEYKEQNQIKYGINTLGLFGSVARGEEKSDSDIDIFIKTETSNPFIIVHVKEDLETLFLKHVDIVRLRDNMNLFLKKRIEKDGIYV